jgi:hypothetical protein
VTANLLESDSPDTGTKREGRGCEGIEKKENDARINKLVRMKVVMEKGAEQ